jgi:ubiquinone/menaquinone biosynthesis C-methylase UbiE
MPRPADVSEVAAGRGDASVVAERLRILDEYQRRETDVDGRVYAPWQPAEAFMRAHSRAMAARMLNEAAVFPCPGVMCLEIGYGRMGWLADLINWGVREADLHGIELNAERARIAQSCLPNADLRIGDATALPWDAGTFGLVVVSTVFTSILDRGVRRRLAGEIERVLAPRGALLWYDFAVNNPRNANVLKVGRRELCGLFPLLRGQIRSITLAPPLARTVVPVSWSLATVLESAPFLRSHLIAVLMKGSGTDE